MCSLNRGHHSKGLREETHQTAGSLLHPPSRYGPPLPPPLPPSCWENICSDPLSHGKGKWETRKYPRHEQYVFVIIVFIQWRWTLSQLLTAAPWWRAIFTLFSRLRYSLGKATLFMYHFSYTRQTQSSSHINLVIQ